jgi:5-oxopent-3-ene-1,2,5-tricarboxylate decarboxylase / 2-hydroxyhepta-2,4-diene-1,7-dioate isomerase
VHKRAVDSLRAGEVLVMEARRDPTAGTLGDILALRAKVRGAAGIITDGAARDAAAVAAIDLPVYTSGQHPAVLGRRHVPWETDTTIACGGATVQVGDVIVADDDGAVVIPPGLVEEVLAAAEQQEREEAWIADRVGEGAGLEGLYPLAGHWRERYEEST